MKILLSSQSCAVFEWVLCSRPIKTPLSCGSTAGATDRKQSTMLLKILCYIYYVHLHTISSVNDYKSLGFLSKIVSSIIYDTMLLVLDGNIYFFFQDMDRWCVMCFIKCIIRIGYTRSLIYSRKLISIGQG